jgi:CBS domain-containing protein
MNDRTGTETRATAAPDSSRLADAAEHARRAEQNAQALHRYLATIASEADRSHRVGRTPNARVADVMTSGVAAAHEAATFKEIVRSLAQNRVSCVPVIDDRRRVVGVVSESDLIAHMILGSAALDHRHGMHRHDAAALARTRDAVLAKDLMTVPAITVHPEASVADAAILAARARVHRLPVIDDAGELIGIVSRADLLKTYLVHDDEILRAINTDVIARRLLLDPAAFDVRVQDGRVRIAGEAGSPAIREQLLDEIRTLDGVVELTDLIRCRSTAV